MAAYKSNAQPDHRPVPLRPSTQGRIAPRLVVEPGHQLVVATGLPR